MSTLAARRTDLGITLIEVCWAMAIAGILAATALTSMNGWVAASNHTSTTAGLEALLRETQQRAVTEGRTLCVAFDLTAQHYDVYRGECGGASLTHLRGPMRPDGGATISSASFTNSAGSTAGVTFYPRGTASPGAATIVRGGSDRVDTLLVDGLTGRVSRA
ncbi:MAG: GspH/FimT family pseudopilin [Sporichthyaceae bacterium]